MRYLAFAGLLLLCPGNSWARWFSTAKTHGWLHWSAPAKFVSPDQGWVVEGRPGSDADENGTLVTIRKRGESEASPLFTLMRDAELHWSSDGRRVLVVNHPWSGTNQLLLFSVPGSANGNSESPPDALNQTVKAFLAERLEKNRHIEFYLPTLVSWKDSNMLVAVGGVTSTGSSLDGYCYGLRIDSETLRVESVLSEKQLKDSTRQSCQEFP